MIFILHTFGFTSFCEGVHLRDGQDQAQAEGLRGGVAQAQDDQVTTLHREGPRSEIQILNLPNNLSMGVILKYP